MRQSPIFPRVRRVTKPAADYKSERPARAIAHARATGRSETGQLDRRCRVTYMIDAVRSTPSRLRPLIASGLATALLLTLLGGSAFAKSYSADRFDAAIKVMPDGSLDVTETVVFRFESGTFTEVFREIPERRTDGIEVIGARMQGERLPFGTEQGTVEVRRRSNRVRVVWRFSGVEAATREFVLNYRVRGAVRKEDAADLLAWRATPGEHRYRIASSTIDFALPAPLAARPAVTARKAGTWDLSVSDANVRIRASNIGSNGWIDASLPFARGALLDAPPIWQQHAAQVAAISPTWMLAAAAVVGAGLVLLFAWRQGYDAPPPDLRRSLGDAYQPAPPDTLAPALAGALAANGRTSAEQAMATILALAERGAIEIQEQPRRLGVRDFVLTRRGASGPISGSEQSVLETIYKRPPAEGDTVSLSKARSRLHTRSRKFGREMERELRSAGFIDEGRKSLRDRYTLTAVCLLIAGGLGFVPAAMLVEQHGAWPMLIPGSLIVIAVVSLIFAAATTPLSNEGVRRAMRWRDFRSHLSAVASDKRTSAGTPVTALLPFAVALGLASVWSKFLKQHAYPAPAWFHALPGDAHAFPAFVAAGGTHGGGVHGGGGGAAGGGASGAG